MHWILISGLLGCGNKDEDSGHSAMKYEPVNATLRLLSVVNGQPIANVSVASPDGSDTTGEDGRGTVEVHSSSNYTIVASQANTMNHAYHGVAGSESFEVVGFLVDRSTTNTVFSMMGVSQDPANGIVVAALDNPDLTPAVGASASLNITGAEPFIFGASGMPQSGDTIQAGGSSFVFFPNVPTGITAVNGMGFENTCHVFPSGSDSLEIVVDADSVHVVVFSCGAE